MPKRFQWNLVPKLILRAEVHRLVPKLFRAEVTRAEHRLPLADPLVLNFYLKCVPLHTKAISSVP